MSWSKWAPLRYIISKAAQRQGFLDPIELLARLRNFAQPSEVGEPIELLRAGVIFHARGLINSKVIQYNLDWVWPYWIERQYDPHGDSFIPRAFSASHINLTHRNWTAIGYPDSEQLPLLDPCGLLTPLYDGWSIDAWILMKDGRCLLPSTTQDCTQQLHTGLGLGITTRTLRDNLSLTGNAHVELTAQEPECLLQLNAQGDAEGWLVLSLRPYNPEGISFVHNVKLADDRKSWLIDGKHRIDFNQPAQKHLVSDYYAGDVFLQMQSPSALSSATEKMEGACKAGMLTAAALFPLGAEHQLELKVSQVLPRTPAERLQNNSWVTLREESCKLRCPDSRYQFLYDAAVSSLILHSPGDVYPGPYTYKRFWFRDAAYIIHALLCLGLHDRAWRALSRFQERQTAFGYFRSQEGEWDANGEVLWILRRYEEFTGRKLPDSWHSSIKRGADWIIHKRLAETPESPHAGLLPPGFSAEHLGPNDYYYWDDFWCISGLDAAAELLQHDASLRLGYVKAARDFTTAVERSLSSCRARLQRPAMPASPYRRLDAGAVGSLAVGYPLQDCPPNDASLLDTVEFLLSDCFVDGAFFQDMIHSGLNAYLTLHVAQILLRAGDPRFLELMDTVAALATPTGQWPEAIHPSTRGGCMGDGHHVWASAEWVLMVRNCFVREEDDALILGAGIPPRWMTADCNVSFGPAPTAFGNVSITIAADSRDQFVVFWKAEWHGNAPRIEIRLPGFEPVVASAGSTSLILKREVETA
jgi:hypothetical protein